MASDLGDHARGIDEATLGAIPRRIGVAGRRRKHGDPRGPRRRLVRRADHGLGHGRGHSSPTECPHGIPCPPGSPRTAWRASRWCARARPSRPPGVPSARTPSSSARIGVRSCGRPPPRPDRPRSRRRPRRSRRRRAPWRTRCPPGAATEHAREVADHLQEVAGAGETPVDAQRRRPDAGDGGHGLEEVDDRLGDAGDGGLDEVGVGGVAGHPERGPARGRIPRG